MTTPWFPEADDMDIRPTGRVADSLYTLGVEPGAGIRVVYGIQVLGEGNINVIGGEWARLKDTLKTAFEASGKLKVQKIDAITAINFNNVTSFFIDFRATASLTIADVIPDYWEIQTEIDDHLTPVSMAILPEGIEVVGAGISFGTEPDNIFRMLRDGGVTVESTVEAAREGLEGVRDFVQDSVEFTGETLGTGVKAVSDAIPGITKVGVVLLALGIGYFVIFGADGEIL